MDVNVSLPDEHFSCSYAMINNEFMGNNYEFEFTVVVLDMKKRTIGVSKRIRLKIDLDKGEITDFMFIKDVNHTEKDIIEQGFSVFDEDF